ncbi:hypothetical protein NFI96_011352 [Prochilodus magdalenae]|nr:hypothetical protein NFI96_011352 [Prochilodus magdalenae]
MAPRGKKPSKYLKIRSVALHKDGLGYKKTPKLRCSTVAKTIQWFNRTDVGVLPALLQRLKGWGQPVSAQTTCRTLYQIGLHGCRPRRKPLLKMMHSKACKQFAEDQQTKDMDFWNHVLWSDKTKIVETYLIQMVSSMCGSNQVRSTKTSVSCLPSTMVVGVSWSECCQLWGATVH